MSDDAPFRPLLVFLTSRRCNLQCDYCNVEAGPRAPPTQLTLYAVEQWVRAFASLTPSEIMVQLHGGEPLLFDPPIELYAATTRNAAREFAGSSVIGIGLQTNGILLDESRIDRLERARVGVTVSLDGPPAIHDKNRKTINGKPSFDGALGALRRLRVRNRGRVVIAVVDAPENVLPSLSFFLDEGLSTARMNPMRPQGRGILFGPRHEAKLMTEMAEAFFEAALRIASHNAAFPERWFHEDNIASIMQTLVEAREESVERGWTFFIDERGALWGHPGGDGDPTLRLVGPTQDPVRDLPAALGITENMSDADRRARLAELHRSLFRACANCPTPELCETAAGHKARAERGDPLCTFRIELTRKLAAWLREDPDAARRTLRPSAMRAKTGAPSHAAAEVEIFEEPAGTGIADPPDPPEEELHSVVRSILDDVMVDDSGAEYIRGYAAWIERLRAAPPTSRALGQLAALAHDFVDADCPDVAVALDALASLDPDDTAAEEVER